MTCSHDSYVYVNHAPISICCLFLQERMETLKNLKSFVHGNALKTEDGIGFAIKCAEEKILEITFDSIIDGLVNHARQGLNGDENVEIDLLASAVALVCIKGGTVSLLNTFVCETEDPNMQSFLNKCTRSLSKSSNFSLRSLTVDVVFHQLNYSQSSRLDRRISYSWTTTFNWWRMRLDEDEHYPNEYDFEDSLV